MSELIERAHAYVAKGAHVDGETTNNGRTLVPELLDALVAAKDAAKTLGRIAIRHNETVLDITGLHHLIDESGDGPWDVVWERLAEMPAKIETLKRRHREFTARLGFGDGITEPAAELADIVDQIKTAFMDAQDHWECPRICEQCGERLAATQCERCHGSGCGAGTASGAYSECEWCAGVGWVHDGCAEMSYADLRDALVAARTDADWFTKQLQDALDPGNGDEWDADDVIELVRTAEADRDELKLKLEAAHADNERLRAENARPRLSDAAMAAATQDDPTPCITCGHPRAEHGDGVVHTACCGVFPPAGSDLDEIECECDEFEADDEDGAR